MQPAGFFEGSGMDISYRGRLNKYFTGFGRYTWSHYESNTGGIGWFPQNQYAPNDEWSNASFDRRHRLGMYAMFHPDGVFNLSAGIFANTGRPWTVTHRHRPLRRRPLQRPPRRRGRATPRPCPSYVDLDLRWGHDFAITPNKGDDAPAPRLLRRRLQHAQPRESLQHRHGGTSLRLRRSDVRQPAPPHPARHAFRVLGIPALRYTGPVRRFQAVSARELPPHCAYRKEETS